MSWTVRGVLAMALHAAKAKRGRAQSKKMETQNHTSL